MRIQTASSGHLDAGIPATGLASETLLYQADQTSTPRRIYEATALGEV